MKLTGRKSTNIEYVLGRSIQKTPFNASQKEANAKGQAIQDAIDTIMVSKDSYNNVSTPEEKSMYNQRRDALTGGGRRNPSLSRRIEATSNYLGTRKNKIGGGLVTPMDLRK